MTLIRIHPDDHVAVAVGDLLAGEAVVWEAGSIVPRTDIPFGHKIALVDLPVGHAVTKYGHTIGRSSTAITTGDWVHSHNLVSDLEAAGELRYHPERAPAPICHTASDAADDRAPTFLGYRRSNGRVATRNEIWIVPTVGCVARVAERIARQAHRLLDGRADGVLAFPHPFGCSQLGDDLDHTQRLLAGLVRHPNAGGVLVIGLGCENNQRAALLDRVAELDAHTGEATDATRIRHFDAQAVADEEETALDAIENLLAHTAQDRRQPCPLSDLVIGLKCGGSDALSGITANPLVGRVTDRAVACGGGALLSEVPEMFGAEQSLANRCVSPAVFADFDRLIRDFKRYFRDHGQPIDENPSPGNKDGGLTTLAEKSLGAIQKGGTAAVSRVLAYGEPAPAKGLTLIESPGNDAVSSTAMVAAGATVLLFTTGRGTPLGFPVPTLKIATNSALATRKPRWIDFDAGVAAKGNGDLADLADALLAVILEIASGQRLARNEHNEEREIAVWKQGVTL